MSDCGRSVAAGSDVSRVANGVGCESDVWGGLIGDLLRSGHSATFRVRGVSMLPTLREGDLVTLRALGEGGANPGDIIAFFRGPCLCLHRTLSVVTGVDGAGPVGYITAGDGLLDDDGEQPADSVIGRVVLVRSRRGDWAPEEFSRRVQSSARTFLGRHPRFRAGLRAGKGLMGGTRRMRAPGRGMGVDS